MKHRLQQYFMLAIISILSFVVSAAPANVTSIDLTQITTTALTKDNQDWFMKEFPRSFMSVYQNKTFVITKDSKPLVLGPKDTQEKNVWLTNTAKEEFHDYVLAPKDGYKALLVQYEKKPIGILLYRMLEKEKIIYLAQYFILPEYQKMGIGSYLLLNILPKLHFDYKRYEILARHQNDAAFLLYTKAGYSIGDIHLVQKYDYDPLRYMGFYKILN